MQFLEEPFIINPLVNYAGVIHTCPTVPQDGIFLDARETLSPIQINSVDPISQGPLINLNNSQSLNQSILSTVSLDKPTSLPDLSIIMDHSDSLIENLTTTDNLSHLSLPELVEKSLHCGKSSDFLPSVPIPHVYTGSSEGAVSLTVTQPLAQRGLEKVPSVPDSYCPPLPVDPKLVCNLSHSSHVTAALTRAL